MNRNTYALDIFVQAIVDATIAYDATGDHRHDGSPVPGDCIRCNVLAALPDYVANRVREVAFEVKSEEQARVAWQAVRRRLIANPEVYNIMGTNEMHAIDAALLGT